MDTTIKQIEKSEVIQAIVDDELVVRINLSEMKICNLASKSIAQIRKDFNNDDYVYLVVEGRNND